MGKIMTLYVKNEQEKILAQNMMYNEKIYQCVSDEGQDMLARAADAGVLYEVGDCANHIIVLPGATFNDGRCYRISVNTELIIESQPAAPVVTTNEIVFILKTNMGDLVFSGKTVAHNLSLTTPGTKEQNTATFDLVDVKIRKDLYLKEL